MLEKLKLRLRLSGSIFDEQIKDYIDECKQELKQQGITVLSDEDPLVISACEAYAKYKFNFDGEAKWYYNRFAALRDNLSKMGAYTKPDEGGETDG